GFKSEGKRYRFLAAMMRQGVRLGNWLTAEQAQSLWLAPDGQRLKGKRDRALLALLLACGLRRHEGVPLTLDHLQQREKTLSHRRLGRQARPRSDSACARLGETGVGRVDRRGCCRSREGVPQSQQSWENMGRWHDREIRVAHREGSGEKHWCCQGLASRSSPDLRSTVPRLRRGVGTNSIPTRACFGSDHRTQSGLQTTNSISG